jgi:NB-ARC domain-containing protein
VTATEFQNNVYGTVQGLVQGSNNTLTINNYGGKPEQRVIPFLAPPRRRSELIGRDAVFEELKQLLLAEKPDPATALTYLVGVGKSALALRLAYDGDVIGKYSDGVLWASLGPTPNISALLGSWATALGITPEELARRHTIENRQQAIHDRIGMSRMLLVVDDAWDVDAANAFLLGGPGCAHLLTTRLPGVAWDFAQDGVITVEPLSEDDGLALLAEMAPEAVESEPEETRKLVRHVGGLPLGLVIIGRFLAHECRTGRPRRVRAALESVNDATQRLLLEAPPDLLEASSTLPEGTKLSLLASIATSEATLSDEARRALRALSALRPIPYTFDEETAKAVTGMNADVLDELEDAGLVEAVGKTRYALQPTIADYARAELSDEEAAEFNRRALDHVNERLRAYEETFRDASPYQRQYRYEQPTWELLEEEFLYHASRAEDDAADLAFAQAYLDGFWWWGCYVESPYCARRLQQWKENPPGAESSEWIDAFTTFHDSYPTGYEKRGRGDWKAVERSLKHIRALAEVDGELDAIEGEQRRDVRLMTDLFLAHASRYRDVSAPDADDYYAEARELCEEIEGDEWIIPWIVFELGDLALERGDVAKAKEGARAALAIENESDPEDRDHEVIANCYRLLADAANGSSQEALESCTLGVFYAYEAIWRDGHRQRAVDWCTYLHDFWREYWEAADVPSLALAYEQALERGARDELKQTLFPPEPDEKSFGDSAWAERVSSLIEQMAPKVGELERAATA